MGSGWGYIVGVFRMVYHVFPAALPRTWVYLGYIWGLEFLPGCSFIVFFKEFYYFPAGYIFEFRVFEKIREGYSSGVIYIPHISKCWIMGRGENIHNGIKGSV